MANLFNSVQLRKPKRNMIPLSYQNILTTKFGQLTPCLCEEALPGDIFKINTELFIRFQPLLAPIMDRCSASLHYFFVPSRILFRDFYPFLTGEDDKAIIPYVTFRQLIQGYTQSQNTPLVGSLADYLNLPTSQFVDDDPVEGAFPVNMLPFLAYQRIYRDYYADENLYQLDDLDEMLKSAHDNGGSLYSNDPNHWLEVLQIRNRAYKKDYFTSALPWPQKGDEVLLPLSEAPVTATKYGTAMTGSAAISAVFQASTTTQNYQMPSGNNGKLSVDLTEVAPSINDLRRSFRIQELLERNARGGTRAQEFIHAHWGVFAKDARLQRPEYIGGNTTPVSISEVLSQVGNNSNPGAGSSLGQLGGHAISAGFGQSKKYKVTEHGYIMAILSVMPHASYFQGIPRMFSHIDKYDFFFPSLANLGEQEIKNKEIFVAPTQSDNTSDTTFGYTPRYAEYKYHPDEVHGDFRDSLSYWHTSRIFANRPGLNESFIKVDDTSVNRIFNYTASDYGSILCQLYHHNKPLRLMPYFGNPKF